MENKSTKHISVIKSKDKRTLRCFMKDENGKVYGSDEIDQKMIKLLDDSGKQWFLNILNEVG